MLPNLTVVLVSSGLEIGCQGMTLTETDVELIAPDALAHMRELMIMPGMVITVQVTAAPIGLVYTKLDDAICCKLFKVLLTYVGLDEHVTMDNSQQVLFTAAFDKFCVLPEVLANILQSLGDCLHAGLSPVGLKCTLCGVWQLDVSRLAVTPAHELTCHSCGGFCAVPPPLLPIFCHCCNLFLMIPTLPSCQPPSHIFLLRLKGWTILRKTLV